MTLSLLYVDDDPDIRTIIGMATRLDPSVRARVAATGDEAVMLASAEPPDAFILDVMMPGLDGLALLRRLRTLPALADVPAIFMTAKTRNVDVERYLAAGAAGTIAKPFDPLTLTADVRRIIAEHPRQGAADPAA